MAIHNTLGNNATESHGPLWQTVANAAALTALTIAAGDVSQRKMILQTDTGQLWVCTAAGTPGTFQEVARTATALSAFAPPTAAVSFNTQEITNAGAPGATTSAARVAELNAKKMFFAQWGAQGSAATTSARFLTPFGSNAAIAAGQGPSVIIAPFAGTFTDIYVRHGTPLTTDSVTYTIQVALADTAGSVTVAANAGTNSVGGLAVTFNAGDVITIKSVQSGTQNQANLFAALALAYKAAA